MSQYSGQNGQQKRQSGLGILTTLLAALPTPAMALTLLIFLALSAGLAYLMLLFPVAGIIGAIAINLVILFFMRSKLALPLYILVAAPSVIVALAGSGILSRLYIGNLLFVMIVGIWIVQTVLPARKSGQQLLEKVLLAPLTALILVGLVSIIYSRLFPDPNVPYTFPHSNVPIIVTNVSEMALLIGLPMFLIVVPGLVRTLRDVRLVIGAYVIIGLMYALGTIFAPQLGLLTKASLLGNNRPKVFGSSSSGLGALIVLFTTIALGQALYAKQAKVRVFWWMLSGIFILGVILAYGREAWLDLLAAVLVMIGFRLKNWTVLLFLLVPLVLLLIPGVSDFFDPTKTYGSDRFKIWQDAINIWLRMPYFGVGAGNYQFFDRFYGIDQVGVAHNQYLEVLAEMGVQGLICLIWLLIAVGYISVKYLNRAKTRQTKAIALAQVGFFAAIILGGFFTGTFIPSAAAGGGTATFVETSYRWLLLGIVLSTPSWEKEAEAAEQELVEAEKGSGTSTREIIPSKTV